MKYSKNGQKFAMSKNTSNMRHAEHHAKDRTSLRGLDHFFILMTRYQHHYSGGGGCCGGGVNRRMRRAFAVSGGGGGGGVSVWGHNGTHKGHPFQYGQYISNTDKVLPTRTLYIWHYNYTARLLEQNQVATPNVTHSRLFRANDSCERITAGFLERMTPAICVLTWSWDSKS